MNPRNRILLVVALALVTIGLGWWWMSKARKSNLYTGKLSEHLVDGQFLGEDWGPPQRTIYFDDIRNYPRKFTGTPMGVPSEGRQASKHQEEAISSTGEHFHKTYPKLKANGVGHYGMKGGRKDSIGFEIFVWIDCESAQEFYQRELDNPNYPERREVYVGGHRGYEMDMVDQLQMKVVVAGNVTLRITSWGSTEPRDRLIEEYLRLFQL